MEDTKRCVSLLDGADVIIHDRPFTDFLYRISEFATQTLEGKWDRSVCCTIEVEDVVCLNTGLLTLTQTKSSEF